MHVVFLDNEAHLGPGDDETFTAYRLKILTPQGLTAGNLSAVWNPSTDELIVNELQIIRDGQAIDVLKSNKFQVLQRENNLEYSMLDGTLTATLQVPGLQIGDELYFAATLRRHDTIFRGRSFGIGQLPVLGGPGVFRLKVSWDPAKQLLWRPSPDIGKLTAVENDGRREITVELRDPASAIGTDGAPPRYNVRRILEYSQFQDWAEVSHALWPLFDKAETLEPNSPVLAQATIIANSTNDPTERAQAALRLVQDDIRYVYVGLDGGNYQPSSADETWGRRFGDCKAKTVLLIALLRKLGIESEAVLVNSKGGDGTNERLPTPAAFDHVLVRIKVGDKTFWLDGTRLGDRRLATLPEPSSRWALPLRSDQADLERLEQQPPVAPQADQLLEVDASAGFEAPAKVRAQEVFRGDVALQLRQGLVGLAQDEAQRQLESFWRSAFDWVEPDNVSWRFDDFENALILNMSGAGKPDWQGDAQTGRTLTLIGAGFSPPGPLQRPKEEDQAAPWLTDFPTFKRWTTIIRLPPVTKQWIWDFIGEPVHRELGGISYWREVALKGNVIVSTMSKRTVAPEITAAEAKEMSDPSPVFDNRMSEVFQIQAATQTPHTSPAPLAASDKDAKRLMSAGQEAAAAGRTPEALADLDQAVKIEPESASILKIRGAVLSKLGRHREALADFDEAWRINPLDTASVNDRIEELRDLGRADEAAALAGVGGGL